MLVTLKNPVTEKYLKLKQHILSDEFPWYYSERSLPEDSINEKYINMPYYGHSFLIRPEGTQVSQKFSKPNSNYVDIVYEVFEEILLANQFIDNYFYLRINANCVHADSGIQFSIPHVDHSFSHRNIIVYLTNSGGNTYVLNNLHEPNEDDVVLFDGEHYMERPKFGRRVILIATIFIWK